MAQAMLSSTTLRLVFDAGVGDKGVAIYKVRSFNNVNQKSLLMKRLLNNQWSKLLLQVFYTAGGNLAVAKGARLIERNTIDYKLS
ncbi:MAG: DUF1659 domain-containing protein [Bacillota bacterium]|nr:DUF1659 domain-containing protein [Bacillota bacterium]